MAPKPGIQDMDETALIKAAQAGDQDAFGQLVRAYDQSVLRLAMNLLRSPEDAQDVYQEAFLRVYRNLNNFRFDCSFHTWLYRIGINTAKNHLVATGRRAPTSTEVEAEDAEGMEEGAVVLTGLSVDRVLQGLELLDKRNRQQRIAHLTRDYSFSNVSDKVVRIIHSYTDYVNRVVWQK